MKIVVQRTLHPMHSRSFLALRGWKTEEINGIQFELNSILVEKWEDKCYRLVIQRQRRNSGDLDLWEGEYTYRCILTKKSNYNFSLGVKPVVF